MSRLSLFSNVSKMWCVSVLFKLLISIQPKSDKSIGLTISLMMRQHSNRKVEGRSEGESGGHSEGGGGVGEKMRLKSSERWFGLPKMPSVSHGKE